MPVTVHNTSIIPGPRTSQVAFRQATVAAARTAYAIQTYEAPGAHYRFTAEGAAVYCLFGETAAEIGDITVVSVAGGTRPGIYIPEDDYLDLFIDGRNRFIRDVSAVDTGFFWIVKASL